MDLSRSLELVLPFGLGTTLLALALVVLGVMSLVGAIYLAGLSVQVTSLILTHAHRRGDHVRQSKRFEPVYIA